MRDDVVYGVHSDPQRACDRGAVSEQLGSAGPHRRAIVLELKRSPFNERQVRAAGSKSEAGRPTEADLAEEVVGDARASPRIVSPEDNRRRTVPHLHEVDELAHVLAGALRIEVDRPRFGADDGDGPDPGRGNESL